MHQQNFIECIRSRKTPNGNIEQGHKSAILVHLANLSYRAGKKQLYFDGNKELITNSEEANLLDKRAYRSGYTMPDKL
jgi:hypothetical protein